MKYMIHAYAPRRWYVDEFLVPSMIEQGIKKEDIDIFCDDGTLGNLNACMMCFEQMGNEGKTWHLQDDVVISHDFKEVTESYDSQSDKIIVNGYCYGRDAPDIVKRTGQTTTALMWYSFPCILIPNYIATACAKWFYDEARFKPEYQTWVKSERYDDAFFKDFMKHGFPYYYVENLVPNIVDHVDYLIGGSIVNKKREEYFPQTRAAYFNDLYLVDELEVKLRKRFEERESKA